jgi:hypothetical protein
MTFEVLHKMFLAMFGEEILWRRMEHWILMLLERYIKKMFIFMVFVWERKHNIWIL